MNSTKGVCVGGGGWGGGGGTKVFPVHILTSDPMQNQLASRDLDLRRMLVKGSDAAQSPERPMREKIAQLEASVEAKEACILKLEV